MTSINDIFGLPQEFKKIQKEENLKRVKTSKETGSERVSDGSASRTDKVDISTTGKKLLEQKTEVSQYLIELENIDPPDEKIFADIQQKIESDFYSEPVVLDKIAETILALSIIKTGSVAEKSGQIDEIREKIKNGDYDKDKILDVIAEKILKTI